MQVSFTNPHPALQPYVNGYFYIELDTNLSPVPLDIHPIGYHTMAFTLGSQQAFKSTSGNYDFSLSYHGYICRHISLIPVRRSINMVVVSFTATGAAELFNVSQHHLVNHIHPMEEVIPKANVLKMQLEEEPISGGKHALKLIENWLLDQIPTHSPFRYAPHIDHACRLIQSCDGSIRISELSKEIGMSQRYMETHFREMIGTSPKLYCRIARFIAAYQFILQNTHIGWHELILRYKYFDQAHFIRDFKTFFGYSPSNIHLANSHLAREILTDF